MRPEELLIFEDLHPPDIPPRTRLHPLPPLGVGTPHVESLAGYISRLALSYCVTTGTLVTREISYVLGNAEPKRGDDSTYIGAKSSGEGINSLSQRSEKWVSALETLTGRSDLLHLTLTLWRNIIPPQRLIRDIRCWCPECYQTALDHEQEPYEQLLWSVREVIACPVHKKPLVTSCPHCGEEQRPLAWRSRPGVCAKCYGWMGSIREYPDASSWDLWRAEVVGQLLGAGSQLATPPTSARISAALQALFRARGFKKIQPFARFLGFDRGIVTDWIEGRRKPRFDSLLVICAKLGVTPLEFLTWDNASTETPSENSTAQLAPDRRWITRTSAESKRLIVDAMQASAPSDSFNKVCKRAGVQRSYIAKLFPDLVEELRATRKQCIAERKAKRDIDFREDVRRAVTSLRRERTTFTAVDVKLRLTKCGLLRSPRGREIFTRVLSEEGVRVGAEDNGRMRAKGKASFRSR